MVLSESDTIVYGSITKSNSPPLSHPQSHLQDESMKDASFSPLSGQNSLLSLTLNEIQHKSGKSFGSMNMDEFLANLWSSVEENQVTPQPNQLQHAKDNGSVINLPPLARQGSFSIPAPLCKKTVDEVWFEIQKEQPERQKPSNIDARGPPQRQQTLGEMTLEDFLVKAGVVQEATQSAGSSLQKMVTPIQNINACLDASFGMGQVMGMGFPTAHQTIGNSFSTGNGFAPYQMFPQSKGFIGEAPNNAKTEQGQTELGMQQNKKRIIDGPPEVVVERRQRRMIKNRESAARSRARKQAYTVELELELNQLKEENAKLKLLVEEIEQNRKEEVLRRKPLIMPKKKVDKLRSIRRTVSLTW
ncbi:ABSCISIC ACID-INSENSITIVE 5-like protein 1 isoform X1 [Ricinus communis]|uniref:ABSCISIC ACID-INSENSITIVE 5-like protein 1 isoform X1 n=2 Tax=Ricinus communis TaxID=3988 RepID=UPI00201AC804|nr:ABSCISIC ACID-INSENSITIVE 5-like protein 1 isoform X1 [Ricinus communis]XP_048234657.1 ABSCISIC ACID-INSENSITIVE 5-like protein 1 isoform X1 [Ricinus communis]XP_048234658.1 ABSCISIC ACID-INSENSITIVE 5-like protein 1 isoform X1 [Ricinus communis]XP_048234659.1 ABSCISIC ACID-INSENSITIVE 5-like protein 1 isoform X1 [Ricinus communis]XP_048234660.1 ABSCISIC ACID-INSENSITIVE 5-like protein 1 isoform X1 [Ricinus communis]